MAVSRGYKQTSDHVRNRVAARLATLAAKPKPVSKDWLEARYVYEGMNCVQIGAMLERDPKTVWAWMRHYGIQTRPRGASHSALPSDGRGFRGRSHSPATKARLSAHAVADGRVPFDRAIGPPCRGKRGADTPNWKGGATPERQAFYCTKEWREAVKVVWARANARCERCCVHHNTVGQRGTFHIHHIVSFAYSALRATPSNLTLLCKTCHRFVHSRKNISRELLKEQP